MKVRTTRTSKKERVREVPATQGNETTFPLTGEGGGKLKNSLHEATKSGYIPGDGERKGLYSTPEHG